MTYMKFNPNQVLHGLMCHPRKCVPCSTMQLLQHLDISTTSSPKTLQCNHICLISNAIDHGGSLLDQSCIGTHKHTKKIKHSLHKLNAPSINVE
jgi:hypothetical protein